jgi:catechol 2,3-dioxygenase-like lactoylglutathione lyase family enzyme
MVPTAATSPITNPSRPRRRHIGQPLGRHETGETMIVGIDHVQLAMPAGREDEARTFYEGLLGIPEVAKPPVLAKRGGAWFENGLVKIHVGVDAEFRSARKAHPGLLVRNLRDLVRRLREAGLGVVEDEPLEGYDRVYVDDPFGNRLELLEPNG